jgi:hypothetical protein
MAGRASRAPRTRWSRRISSWVIGENVSVLITPSRSITISTGV